MANETELGAHVVDGGRTRFRVWAPKVRTVQIETYPHSGDPVYNDMSRDEEGVWGVEIDAESGTHYRFRLNDEWGYPDPYSRSQPDGVHGPSQVVDPKAFDWTDDGWRGLDSQTLVIYELHVGAYTADGTFDALIKELGSLVDLGVTAVELMPVAEFPGRWNWGYDGVSLFAPSSVYGGPDGLRQLVDAAHGIGLGVILDVVYNHLGPDGNYLGVYSDDYFTDRYQTPWGDAMNFDGENALWTRRLVVDNARMWTREYHVDGFRLDATEQIYDRSNKHILQELAEAMAAEADNRPQPLLIAEHEHHDLRIVTAREDGGYGLDGLWLDDFHHAAHVLLTGEREGYYGRYQGSMEELAGILESGALYGAEEARQLQPERPVFCLQNHDQVGNRPQGERLSHLVDLERYKAAYALLLLSSYTPLIFMGDEFAASTPFLFFTDHKPELSEQITSGRRAEFSRLWAGSDPADPQDEETFLRSRVDLSERNMASHSGVRLLFKELIALRKVLSFSAPSVRVCGTDALSMLRRDNGRTLLVAANFGEESKVCVGEPGGSDTERKPVLCSAEERFSGPGIDLSTLELDAGGSVLLPPRAAVVWSAGV